MADIAFEARGKTLEALFSSAGQAVTAAQLHDLRTIRKKESRTFDLTNKAIDMLLFNFLQELIYWKDVDLLLFKSFDLSILQKADGNYHLTGTGQGADRRLSASTPGRCQSGHDAQVRSGLRCERMEGDGRSRYLIRIKVRVRTIVR